MTNPTVAAPAGFAPQMAVSFASSGIALPVDADHPLPVGERAYYGSTPIVADTDQPAGRAIAITCTMGGNIVLKLADESLLTVPIEPGFAILPLAVCTVATAGTTAVATCVSLA